MRPSNRRTAGTIATAATVLIGSVAEPAPAAQVRGTLSVIVQVLAACGGSVGVGGEPEAAPGCPSGSTPMAILSESATTPTSPLSAATLGFVGELRYVTLIY